MPGNYGSLLEQSWQEERPPQLSHASSRTFLANGDTIASRGRGFQHGYLADLSAVTAISQL
ncbi:hypothetical protein [Spirosoma lituiforme]